MSITRYALVNTANVELDHEYDDYHEAVEAAQRAGDHAVLARTYVLDEDALVWTPEGHAVGDDVSLQWPPSPSHAVINP